LVYFDQLFSYQYSVPTNIDYNIKFFNNSNSKTANLLFNKYHNNGSYSSSSTDHSSGHSKSSRKYVTTNGRYTYLRPAVNGKGDLLLVPGLDLGKHSSNSISNVPPAPKPSNLSTPSTMSPLFPSSVKSDPFNESYPSRSSISFNLSYESQGYTIPHSIHTKSTGDIPVLSDNDLRKKHSSRRNTFNTADFADRRKRIIESVQFKIKESNMTKSVTKTTISSKISSGLKSVDSNIVSKLLNKPTGNLDPRHIEVAQEMRSRQQRYEARRLYKLYNKK
jgi:hypothetical protein